MAIWNRCAICGRAIPVGEPCYGVKDWRGDPIGGDTICRDCLVPENEPTLTQPNEPLTIEQLREMDGEPAWWDNGEGSCWGIISVDSAGMWGGIPFFRGRWRQVNFEYNIEERKMRIYRRPPEVSP